MAKSLLRIKSRDLRATGKSIKEIAGIVGIAKSTVSLWCRDIELTKKQIENLLNKQRNGLKLGQINAALIKRSINKERIEKYDKEAQKELGTFSQKEFLICGLALYLAEGAKKERRIKFINSDPRMIGFMLNWFKINFQLSIDRFIFSIIINKIHKKRESKIKEFWSKYLDIPMSQFRKTFFVKSKQNKIYENYDNYYGTINFRILQSADLFYKIQALSNRLLDIKTMSA